VFDELHARASITRSTPANCHAVSVEIDRLGLAQRIILVLALAFVVLAVGVYLMFLGAPVHIPMSSFVPASASGQRSTVFGFTAFQRPVLSPWEDLLVWVGLIAVWATGGLWLLRPTRSRQSTSAEK
jgi:hypothetical protein